VLKNRRGKDRLRLVCFSGILLRVSLLPSPAAARPPPVNRPDLLPKTANQPIIQTEPTLTKGQVARLTETIARIEKATGIRVRILCQQYPQTPGLAIKEYWNLGDSPGDIGGDNSNYRTSSSSPTTSPASPTSSTSTSAPAPLSPYRYNVPTVFFSRLSSKFGSIFFVRDNGRDVAERTRSVRSSCAINLISKPQAAGEN